MLTAEQSILALIRTIIIGNEDIEYLGSNEIGNEGCSYLSKVYWPSLKNVDLCKENIE